MTNKQFPSALIASQDLTEIVTMLQHELNCSGADYAAMHRNGDLTDADYKHKRANLREQGNILNKILTLATAKAAQQQPVSKAATRVSEVIEQLQLISVGNTPAPAIVTRTDPSTHAVECECYYCKEIK